MPVKVSVVVPVYNPGTYIEACINSLIGQSLPRDEYELVFVDDGSTDGTAARLDALAAAEPNVKVIHEENSGWAGKPRNVGIDAASGEYIQFVDADDYLAGEALERLYALAAANNSDIVIGKLTSFRGAARGLFARNRAACSIRDAPLIDSLGPIKMFRTAMIREHGLRFPEVKQRLEDQLFVVRAYFAAQTVSVLADYPIYFHVRRVDGENIGSRRIDPPGYYGNLREIIDVVIANTTPGKLRDGLIRRFYRVEALGRLNDAPVYLDEDPAFRASLFNEVRDLARDVVGDGVDGAFGSILRARSRLLRADRYEDFLEFSRRVSRYKAFARIERIRWRGGRLLVSFVAEIRESEVGTPLTYVRSGDRYVLDPALTEGIFADGLDVTGDAAKMSAKVSLRQRATNIEWFPAESATAELAQIRVRDGETPRVQPIVRATVTIDPLKGPPNGPLGDGTWDLTVRLGAAGLDRSTRLGNSTAASTAVLAGAVVGAHCRPVVAVIDPDGRLHIDVGRPTASLARAASEGVRFWRDGRALEVLLPLHAVQQPVGSVDLVVRDDGTDRVISSRLSTREERAALVAEMPKELFSGNGGLELLARLDGPDGDETTLGKVTTPSPGVVRVAREQLIPARERARLTGVGAAVRVYRSLPRGLRRRLRGPLEDLVRPLVIR